MYTALDYGGNHLSSNVYGLEERNSLLTAKIGAEACDDAPSSLFRSVPRKSAFLRAPYSGVLVCVRRLDVD